MVIPSLLNAQGRDSTCTPAQTPDSLDAAVSVRLNSYNPTRPVPDSYVRSFLNEFGSRLQVPEPFVLGTYVSPVWINSKKDWTRGYAGMFALVGISVEDRQARPSLLVSTAAPAFDRAILEAVRSMEADDAVPLLPESMRRGKHELRLRVSTVQEVDSGQPLFRLRVPLARFASPARPQMRTHGGLRYPRELRRANIQGGVLMQFVIDADGAPLERSLLVLQATHPLFAESVLEFVRKSTFEPARIGSCPVALIVTQEFNFTIGR